MRRVFIRFFAGGALSILSFSVCLEASALCCACHPPGDANVTCLTGSAGTCAAMLSTSNNPAISGYVCDKTMQAAECRPIASGGQCPTTQSVLSTTQGYLPPPSTAPALIAPELNVPIPGLVLSAVPSTKRGTVVIPFIAQYVSAMYSYLVGLTLVVAAMMIIYGGFRYILGSTMGSIQAGKDIIQNALIGLVLLLGSYTILNVVNPEAANLKPLEVHIAKRDVLTDFLLENGTTYEGAPVPEAKKVIDGKPGTLTSATGAGPAPNPADQPGDTTPPVPTPEVPRGDMVDVSGLAYESGLSATENIFKYCSGGATVANAKTYNEKIKLLVKSVLGFKKVCIDKSRCVYTQAGMSGLPSGKLGNGAPLANFAVTALVNRQIETLESLWPNNPECIQAWKKEGDYAGKKGGPYVVNTMAQCNTIARNVYNEKINRKIEEAKVFASDCVGLVISAYSCAGPKYAWPADLGPAVQKMMKNQEPTQFMARPQVIAFTKISDPKLQEKLNAKGGIKFGDLLFVCCGGGNGQNNMHWYMYTGGRPDVPFTFIEMGGAGNGANIPGVGHIGGANIKLGTLADDIAAKTTASTATYWGCKPANAAKCQYTKPPSYNPSTALILIWRPYAEATSAASGTP